MSDVGFELPTQSIDESLHDHHDSVLEGRVTVRSLVPEVYYQLDNVVCVRFDVNTDNLKEYLMC